MDHAATLDEIDSAHTSGAAGLWIPVGAVLFVVALIGAAAVVPQLRWLHFFQALIYVAVVALTRRRSAFAFGAGTVVSIAWNALNLFITHLMQAGGRAVWAYVQTGHAARIDTMMVFVGGIAHFVLMAACVTAFLASRPDARAWRAFASGGISVLVYMAAIIVAFAPH
jgi:hypothetical protein